MSPLSWLPFSLLATMLFGFGMTMYKLPSARGHSRATATLWAQIVSLLIALFLFSSDLDQATPALIGTAAIWGATFTSIMLLQMYALGHVDTSALFPVTTTASLILTILVGIFAFGEHPVGFQVAGILLAVAAVYGFLYKGKQLAYSSVVLLVGSGIILISTFNKTLLKIAADGFDIHAFQVYQYAFAALFACLFFLGTHARDWRSHLFGEGVRIGALIGTFGMLGGYALFLALQRGPFPLVMSVHSLYIFVGAIVAAYLLKERLTRRTFGLMILAVLAIALMRLS